MIYFNTSNTPRLRKEISLNVEEILPYKYESRIYLSFKKSIIVVIKLFSRGKTKTNLYLTSILESFSRIEDFTKSNTSYMSEVGNHFLTKNDFSIYHLKARSSIGSNSILFSSKDPFIDLSVFSYYRLIYSPGYSYFFTLERSGDFYNFKLIKYSSNREKYISFEKLKPTFFVYSLSIDCPFPYIFVKEFMKSVGHIFDKIFNDLI